MNGLVPPAQDARKTTLTHYIFSSLGSGILRRFLRTSNWASWGRNRPPKWIPWQISVLVDFGRPKKPRFRDIWGVPKNRGFSPQIIHFNRVFHYKPSILGYPNFRKPPYRYCCSLRYFLVCSNERIRTAMEPPLTPTTKSLVSIGTNIYLTFCQLFHLSQEEKTHHTSFDKGRNLSGKDHGPTHNLGPPRCLSTAQLSIPPLKAVSSDQPEQRKRSSYLQQITRCFLGRRKNGFKAFHQLCHDFEIWGLFLFFGCSPFFWGGGGREWILGVSPHPLNQRRHLSETRTCGTCGLLWKRTSKVPKGLHHVLGFIYQDTKQTWTFLRGPPNKAMS